jgi:ADP-heptose:LPS heptosyltransferase
MARAGHPLTPDEAANRLREAHRVLLVALGPSLSELLATTPVIANLRAALPRARLVAVCDARSAPALLGHPDLDEVHPVPDTGFTAPFRRRLLLRRLRQEPCDIALCVTAFPPQGASLAFLQHLSLRSIAGLDDGPLGGSQAAAVYDCVVPAPEDSRNVVDQHLALLEGLGVAVQDRRHRLGVTATDRERGRDLLVQVGLLPNRPILGAHVGGAPYHPERQWPAPHYAAVLQRSMLELGYQIVLLGTTRDAPTLDAVQSLGKATLPRLLDLSFSDYKAALSRLDFFLTHDGDPVHIAAALGVPSYFLFLSTPAWKWAPYGSHVTVWEEPDHVPSSAEVWTRLKPLLENAAAGGAGTEGTPPA